MIQLLAYNWFDHRTEELEAQRIGLEMAIRNPTNLLTLELRDKHLLGMLHNADQLASTHALVTHEQALTIYTVVLSRLSASALDALDPELREFAETALEKGEKESTVLAYQSLFTDSIGANQ